MLTLSTRLLATSASSIDTGAVSPSWVEPVKVMPLKCEPAGPVKKSDLNPQELSARGKSFYNELARELGMKELQEGAPGQMSELVSER